LLGAVSLAFLFSACGGSGRNTSSTINASYAALVSAGVKQLGDGNPAAASKLFQQAIARNPGDAVAYYDLGVAYQREDHPRQALRQYRLAIQRDPQYVPALYNEAVLLTGRDNPTAMFLYRQVIALKPHSPTALLNLGLLEATAGGVERQAYRHLTLAMRLDPSLRTLVPGPVLARVREVASREQAPRRASSPP
jgi:Tfp pilus assembly protein PilF